MKKISFVCIAIVFLYGSATAQSLNDAAQFQRDYRFDKAAAIYEKLLESDPADEQALKGLVWAENGKSLIAHSAKPTVMATKQVSRKDFFLYYSHLADKSWSADGNYCPAGAKDLYISKKGIDGYEIFHSIDLGEGEWSDAEKVVEGIFPMLSTSGKKLYFASDALFGMGGYDLYVATWNERTRRWDNVQNLGFPYSSTGDDFLFCDTPDGKYSIFASNRDCDKDNVIIYVLRQENLVTYPLSENEARNLAHLPVTYPDNGYSFSKHSLGSTPVLEIESKDDSPDAFKIGEKGAFAVDNKIHDGIVYMIQLFVTSNKPKIAQLKGISPVYSKKQPSGKTLYAAGQFDSYPAAEKALAEVKKAGFPSAFIIAYENGKSIAVSKARQKKSSTTEVIEEVHIVK